MRHQDLAFNLKWVKSEKRHWLLRHLNHLLNEWHFSTSPYGRKVILPKTILCEMGGKKILFKDNSFPLKFQIR